MGNNKAKNPKLKNSKKLIKTLALAASFRCLLIIVFVVSIMGITLYLLDVKRPFQVLQEFKASLTKANEASAFLNKLSSIEGVGVTWSEVYRSEYSYDTDAYWPNGYYGSTERRVSGYSRVLPESPTSKSEYDIDKQFRQFASNLAKGWQTDKYNGRYTLGYKKITGDNQIILKITLRYITKQQFQKCPCFSYEVFYSDPFSVNYIIPTLTTIPAIEISNNLLPSIPPSFKTTLFVKRQLDVTKNFFDKYNYPDEVKNIPDDQLVGMRCSYNVYEEKGKGFTLIDYGQRRDKGKRSKESFYQVLRNKLTLYKSYTEPLDINFCLTEDGRKFIAYGHANFAMLINSDTAIEDIVRVNMPFMSCGYPIELTKDGIIYYACQGGDTRGHADLLKINLNNKMVKNIFSCVYDFPFSTPSPELCTSNINYKL